MPSSLTGNTSLSGNPAPEDSSQIETTLRLVCSMSGNLHRACWEDVTDDTPLIFGNGCVQFTSILSASFWLIECPNWMISDVMCLVDQLYKVSLQKTIISLITLGCAMFCRRYVVLP
jgi:hypothetical protein